jgi:hypothetical protein
MSELFRIEPAELQTSSYPSDHFPSPHHKIGISAVAAALAAMAEQVEPKTVEEFDESRNPAF